MFPLVRLVAVVLCIHAGFSSASAHEISTRSWIDASGVRWTETVETWTDDPGLGEAIDPDAGDPSDAASSPSKTESGDRLVDVGTSAWSTAPTPAPAARFGPFVVLDAGHAMLVRETDTSAPRQFARMLAAYPGIRVLEFRDCPGTLDDNANLVLGRMIHQRGIETVVPAGGSVRSGAVDLFLAGVRRIAAADAEFAVHAWLDEDGLRPTSFAPTAPINRRYVVFYHEAGGMPLPTAKAFYDLTNSVPNERALWLTPRDIARYAAIEIY